MALSESELLILGLISSNVRPMYSHNHSLIEKLVDKKLITVSNRNESLFDLTILGKWEVFNYYCESKFNDYQTTIPLHRYS